MKKYIFLVMLLASLQLTAQTNTFPQDGHAGVGTLSPENSEGWQKVLEVKGLLSSKTLTSTNSVIAGTWANNLGIYGAVPGGITGTFTNHPYSFITNKLTRMVISANGNIGVGTSSPSDLLVLDAGNVRRGLTITGQGNGTVYSDISMRVKDQQTIQVGKPFVWSISHRKDGYFSDSDASGTSLEFYSNNVGGGYFAPLSFKANGDVVIVSNKNAVSGNVGIGTTTPREKLSVNGNVRAKEIKVENANWPDYVLADGYKLPSLRETEKYIKEKGHLLGIPSASEVKVNGIELGKMNAMLLEKIEELILHLIEKDKQISNLQEENRTNQIRIIRERGLLNDLIQRIEILEKKRNKE